MEHFFSASAFVILFEEWRYFFVSRELDFSTDGYIVIVIVSHGPSVGLKIEQIFSYRISEAEMQLNAAYTLLLAVELDFLAALWMHPI